MRYFGGEIYRSCRSWNVKLPSSALGQNNGLNVLNFVLGFLPAIVLFNDVLDLRKLLCDLNIICFMDWESHQNPERRFSRSRRSSLRHPVSK